MEQSIALQTFRDEYVFYGNVQEIGKQIGNAVPVLLAKVMGDYVLREHNKIKK